MQDAHLIRAPFGTFMIWVQLLLDGHTDTAPHAQPSAGGHHPNPTDCSPASFVRQHRGHVTYSRESLATDYVLGGPGRGRASVEAKLW